MRQSLRLGRVAGIPVGVHWSVGVIVMLIASILSTNVLPAALPGHRVGLYWIVAVAAALVFAASLLAHELAHAVVAKRHGVQVRSITLWMLGGVAELGDDPPDPAADLRIALAGPAASVVAGAVLAGLAIAIGRAPGPLAAAVAAAAAWLAIMNGMLAVFNLLPGAPMDGGRVLRAVLWRRYGDRRRAALAATKVGRYLGFGLMALGLAEALWTGYLVSGLWLVLVGWFLESAARAEARATMVGWAVRGLLVEDVMTPDPDVAPGWNTVPEFAERVLAYSRQSAFPVIDAGGRLTGVVTNDMLARIRPAERPAVRISQVAREVPDDYLAAPADPVAPLLARPPLAGEVVAVVLDGERVAGIVTTENLSWVVRRAQVLGDLSRHGAGDLAAAER